MILLISLCSFFCRRLGGGLLLSNLLLRVEQGSNFKCKGKTPWVYAESVLATETLALNHLHRFIRLDHGVIWLTDGREFFGGIEEGYGV